MGADAKPRPLVMWPNSPALVLWGLFLLLVPLYVSGSGLPQPSDALVVLLVPVTIAGWNGRIERRYLRIVQPLMLFVLWVWIVNYGWAAILGRWSSFEDFLAFPLFYTFNATLLFAAIVLARRDRMRFLRVTVDAVFLSVLIQSVVSFTYKSAFRGTLFFNNPNQLGYYALLAAVLFALTQKPLGLGRLRSSIAVTACAYLALLSASRAALAGIAVLLFVLVFANPKTVVIASLAAVGLLTIGGPVSNAIDAVEKRATQPHNTKESFAEERGYDRLWEYSEYLVLGAGEGAVDRFAAPGEQGRELHSSFSTVLFSYGVVGVVIFFVFFVRCVRGAPWQMNAMLVPAIVYTLAHNGLRFTMLWVMIAVFVVLPQKSPAAVSAARARLRPRVDGSSAATSPASA